jgi:hypothetical protein
MVIAAVGDAAAVAGAINDVASALDKAATALIGGRSVILQLDNHTQSKLTMKSHHHEHGNFALAPGHELGPGKTMVFGSASLGGAFLVGTEGNVVWEGDGFTLTITWDNPEIGSNSCNTFLSGSKANLFTVHHICGGGNTNAHMRFELFRR